MENEVNGLEWVEDQVKRMEIQKTWKERLNGVLSGNRTAFCEKYGLNNSVLCRYEQMSISAGWESINKIENALKSEGQ